MHGSRTKAKLSQLSEFIYCVQYNFWRTTTERAADGWLHGSTTHTRASREACEKKLREPFITLHYPHSYLHVYPNYPQLLHIEQMSIAGRLQITSCITIIAFATFESATADYRVCESLLLHRHRRSLRSFRTDKDLLRMNT